MVHNKTSFHYAQISVTIAYLPENCTVDKMCLRSCLEDVSYQTILYEEDETISFMETETAPRKCACVITSIMTL